MRTDLDSMNPGKAMAQAHHAGMAFAAIGSTVQNLDPSSASRSDLVFAKEYRKYIETTEQGFGTVITLGVDEATMNQVVDRANEFVENGVRSGIIHDPTYPLIDGDVVHLLPVDTCGWVFCPNPEKQKILFEGLRLHR